ncbi:MAG: hypothetical protein ACLGJC_05710 [Alphaproteobacteria bacterium]
MALSPIAWAHRYAPDSASVLLRDGPVARSVLKSLPWVSRAKVVSDLFTDSIEEAVESKGLARLLESARNRCQTIRGGTFAAEVDQAVRAARGVLTVALLGMDGDGRSKEPLAATDVFSASVLLLTAEPSLQSHARDWIAGGTARVRQIGQIDLLGFGAALLSAHMSGPAFPEDVLPLVAGDLLNEVTR